MIDIEKVNLSLNNLLNGALAAACHFLMLSEMDHSQGHMGYSREMELQGVDEIHFAGWLIERIFVFKGNPVAARLDLRKIDKRLSETGIQNRDEFYAIRACNAAIYFAQRLDHQPVAELLQKILRLEVRSNPSYPYTIQNEPMSPYIDLRNLNMGAVD
jgi:bacterioferritin (cytochrome b1)